MPATGQADGDPGSLTGSAPHRDVLATAKGSGFLAAGSLIEFASRFLILYVLARGLGVADYGLYVLGISAASLFAGVSMLGLDDAMVRYVAILSGRRDDDGVSGTLQLGLGVTVITGIAMGGVLFVFAEPIAEGLFDEPDLTQLLRLFALVVPFLTVSNVLLGTTRGFRRMDHAALAEHVVQSLVRLVLVLLLAVVGRLNVYAAAVVFGIADISASLTMIVLLNRGFPLRRSVRPGARRDVRAVFGFALPLWLSGLLRQFRRNIQAALLGTMSSVSSVGVFAVVQNLNMVADTATNSIYTSVKPILAQLHDRGDRAGLAHLYATTTRWTLGFTIPFFLVMVLFPKAILAVFGEDFTAGTSALVVSAFTQLVAGGTGTCQGMLDMTGHTRAKLANTVVFTTLLIGGGALLIPRWDILGAATAGLIAVAAVNVIAIVEVRVLERLLPFDRSFVKPIAAGLFALLAGLAMRTLVPVGTDFGKAVVQGVLVSALYIGLVIRLGLADTDRLVLDRFLGRARGLAGRRRTAPTSIGGGTG